MLSLPHGNWPPTLNDLVHVPAQARQDKAQVNQCFSLPYDNTEPLRIDLRWHWNSSLGLPHESRCPADA